MWHMAAASWPRPISQLVTHLTQNLRSAVDDRPQITSPDLSRLAACFFARAPRMPKFRLCFACSVCVRTVSLSFARTCLHENCVDAVIASTRLRHGAHFQLVRYLQYCVLQQVFNNNVLHIISVYCVCVFVCQPSDNCVSVISAPHMRRNDSCVRSASYTFD